MSQYVIAADSAPTASGRSPADAVMCRLLRIPQGPASVDEAAAHRIFSASILLSAFRCLLGYVVLPILGPTLGAAAGAGPAIGLPIGVVALVFDVRGIRRFWLANHRWRWAITGLYGVVMILVSALVIGDLVHLVG